MNVYKIRLIYAAIILTSLVVIGYSLYAVYQGLGGFEKVEIYKLEPIKRTVAGKYFHTIHTDPLIEEHLEKCKSLVANDKIDGELLVVHYLNDSLGAYDIEEFIGIALNEDVAEIPVDFEVREYESNDRYAIFLSMHPIVRPTTAKIEGMIFARSQEDSLELENFFMEFYYRDNSMSIEGWIK